MFIRLFNKKRYFIVFYTAHTPTATGSGSISFEYDSFANRKAVERDLMEKLPEQGMKNIVGVVLNSILEVSKEDYEIWRAE